MNTNVIKRISWFREIKNHENMIIILTEKEITKTPEGFERIGKSFFGMVKDSDITEWKNKGYQKFRIN